MSLIIEMEGDGAKFDQDVALAFSKIKAVNAEAEKAEFSVSKLLMRASMVIGGINAALSLTRNLTGKTIDVTFLAMIQNMISLQSTLATFGAAQVALGNWAWLPIGIAILGLASSVTMQLKQQSMAAQLLLDEREAEFVNNLEDF